jgi:hypothetical protein
MPWFTKRDRWERLYPVSKTIGTAATMAADFDYTNSGKMRIDSDTNDR